MLTYRTTRENHVISITAYLIVGFFAVAMERGDEVRGVILPTQMRVSAQQYAANLATRAMLVLCGANAATLASIDAHRSSLFDTAYAKASVNFAKKLATSKGSAKNLPTPMNRNNGVSRYAAVEVFTGADGFGVDLHRTLATSADDMTALLSWATQGDLTVIEGRCPIWLAQALHPNARSTGVVSGEAVIMADGTKVTV